MELLAHSRLEAAVDPVMDIDADTLLTYLAVHCDFDFQRPKVHRQSNTLNIIADAPVNGLPKGFSRLGKDFEIQLTGIPGKGGAKKLEVQVHLAWTLYKGVRKMAVPIFIGTLDVNDPWDPRFASAKFNWLQ